MRVVPESRSRALVRAVVPPRLGGTTAPVSAEAQAVRRLLLASDRHFVRTLLPVQWAAGVASHADFGTGQVGVRSASARAFALAVSTETGAYDEAAVGRSADFARGTAVWLVRSLACGHAAVAENGWGAGDHSLPADLHQWQSPLWAMQAGAAGWLLWPYLTDTDRYRVAAMVVNEADRLVSADPQYYGSRSGRVLRAGDTKAEEDAWLGTILALASAMLPNHPHRDAWRHQEIRFELAAYSTPADLEDDSPVHGAPLRTWLDGWNVRPDGTVVNHRRVHPHYAASVTLSASAAALHGLAGAPTPRSSLHGLDLIYRSLTSRPFPSPPFEEPGGTVYRPGSSDIYLPQGNDWGTRAAVSAFVLLDAAAHVAGTSPDAADYERRHAAELERMQARSWDGRSYQSRSEHRYPAAEAADAENLARAWLLEWAAENRRVHVTNADAPARQPISRMDSTGSAWTRYRARMLRPAAGARDRSPAGATSGTVVLTDRPMRSSPLPDIRMPSVTTDEAQLTVVHDLPPRAAVPVTVHIVLAPPDRRGGYLVEIPSSSADQVTVVGLSDGRLMCSYAQHHDTARPRSVRIPARCVGGSITAAVRVVASSAAGSPTGLPFLAVAR